MGGGPYTVTETRGPLQITKTCPVKVRGQRAAGWLPATPGSRGDDCDGFLSPLGDKEQERAGTNTITDGRGGVVRGRG